MRSSRRKSWKGRAWRTADRWSSPRHHPKRLILHVASHRTSDAGKSCRALENLSPSKCGSVIAPSSRRAASALWLAPSRSGTSDRLGRIYPRASWYWCSQARADRESLPRRDGRRVKCAPHARLRCVGPRHRRRVAAGHRGDGASPGQRGGSRDPAPRGECGGRRGGHRLRALGSGAAVERDRRGWVRAGLPGPRKEGAGDRFPRGPAGGRHSADVRAGWQGAGGPGPGGGTYRGHRLVTMPPPSSGGMILIGLLNVLEREDPTAGGYKPEPYLNVMIEAEKRLYAHREGWGDPDFNPGMAPIARQVISKEFARTLRESIGDRATPAQQVVNAQEGAHTTHVSVVDAQGNAVALTTTVNEPFGSCVVAQGTGVLLNDEMDDFAVAPGVMNAFDVRGGSENGPGPGKVPLSSMAPTFVFTPGGELRLVLGAAGGSTIPTTVAQAIVQVLDYRMPIDRALAAPRIHHNLFPDVIRVEPQGMEASTARALEARGHRIEYRPRPWAKVSAVEVDPQTGWRIGAVDASFDGAGAAQ